MSKIKCTHVFTSESVSEGHPDKICDQLSDSVLDACLEQDANSRVACECLVTTDIVVMSGEITTNAKFGYDQLARNVLTEIGYNSPDIGFSAESCKVLVCIHRQSADISLGVTVATNTEKEQGAGDQGMMFGYASDETAEFMPAPIIYAHKIVQRLAELRHRHPEEHPFLRPDAKSQVSVLYDRGVPVRIETVVVSHQHTPDMKDKQLRGLVAQVVKEVIPAPLLHKGIKYYVNPTGRFVIGGPAGDTGLTGRKIIVDTYGGVGCHGGGSFSGKDPSKVDRSAAYMCRYLAKNVVAAGLARKCEVQVAYAIGVARPLSINIDTFGTGAIPDVKLQDIIQTSDIFDFRPAQIVATLGLKTPHRKGWTYRETAAYGHFGRPQFPWEKLDKVAALKKAVK